MARYKRMTGHNVLHPIGWDAFGLPAEQYAIQTGTHPALTTRANIDRFRTQLKSLGFSYDWDREVDTTDPAYYKWTQWIFLKLWEKGLAYQAEVRESKGGGEWGGGKKNERVTVKTHTQTHAPPPPVSPPPNPIRSPSTGAPPWAPSWPTRRSSTVAPSGGGTPSSGAP